MIHIEYDDASVAESDAKAVSEAICAIVSKVTEIEDVFVYANTAELEA